MWVLCRDAADEQEQIRLLKLQVQRLENDARRMVPVVCQYEKLMAKKALEREQRDEQKAGVTRGSVREPTDLREQYISKLLAGGSILGKRSAGEVERNPAIDVQRQEERGYSRDRKRRAPDQGGHGGAFSFGHHRPFELPESDNSE